MKIRQSKRAGRPTGATPPGEKTTLSLRVSPSLRARLDASAKAEDRTLSKEAELRLEQSYRDQRLMIDALVLLYGRPMAGLLLAIADAMNITGTSVGFGVTRTPEGAHGWLDNATAYKAAITAATTVLETLRPPGDVVDLKADTAEGAPEVSQMLAAAAANPGAGYARGELAQISGELVTGGRSGEMAIVKRELLGHLVERIKLDRRPLNGEDKPGAL